MLNTLKKIERLHYPLLIFICIIYKMTNLIINLYQEQLAAVRLESGLTDWFNVKRGVRQGCILSPPIFSMYTETTMRKVEADGELTSFNVLKMHGKEVKELR